MSTFANMEDPDEMQHNARLHCQGKKIFRKKENNTYFFENYSPTPLYTCMYNGLSHVYLSNQKEESISIQRVNTFLRQK